MGIIDALNTVDQGGAEPSHRSGGILAALDTVANETPVEQAPIPAPTTGNRVETGVADNFYGLGQLAQHVIPDGALNFARDGMRGLVSQLPNKLTDSTVLDPRNFANTSTTDFDNIVAERERQYELARQQAGQTGIDWWRIAGNAVNPLNYVSAGGSAATAVGRIGQAAVQGGLTGSLQPAASPGSFWYDKLKQAATGAGTGASVGATIEAAVPALRAGVNWVRNTFGGNAAPGTAAGQASNVVHSALQAQGVDPNAVNLDVLASLKREAQEALESGHDPNPTAIYNRAVAESLPVPYPLMRSQATRDGSQWADMMDMRGLKGPNGEMVGAPIQSRLEQQNRVALQNLDLLGARNAPDTVSTSNWIDGKVMSFWDGLQQRKTDLYDAVKNGDGKSAMMDQFTAADQIRQTLDTPQALHAWDAVRAKAPEIDRTLNDLEDGKLPLTVAQFTALDKQWGAKAASVASTDGTAAYAINQARRILGDAPIQDELGENARAAYDAARQAHAQQMSLVDRKLPNQRPNPNYSPLVDSVVYGGKAPETLFGQHFMNAPASVASKNLELMRTIDPNAPELIGRTLMGEIKRQAVNSKTADNVAVSADKLTQWASNPMKNATLGALLPDEAAQTFRNLALTHENAMVPPAKAPASTSNSGRSVINSAMRVMGSVGRIGSRFQPVDWLIGPVRKEAELMGAQSNVANELQPGVTLNSLLSSTPAQAFRNRLAGRVSVPGFAAGANAVLEGSGSSDEK